jgi:hypothetical protein
MTDPGPHRRPLYPPGHPKGQSSPGSDIVAVKRAISRAGYWKWQEFSDDYTTGFAHGDANGRGVAGFQADKGIDPTGNYGEPTHDKLRNTNVPSGAVHAGQDCFDAHAADLYKNYKPPPQESNADKARQAIVEFANKGLANGSKWSYTQNRAIDVSVDPAGKVSSDCSGSVIQAFNYAKRVTGVPVPDPAKYAYGGWGNTWDDEDGHPKVSGSYKIGDLAHYDGHVTMCIKAGDWDTADWWSFGSEPPSKRKLGYRSDFKFVVRPPLV